MQIILTSKSEDIIARWEYALARVLESAYNPSFWRWIVPYSSGSSAAGTPLVAGIQGLSGAGT